MKKNIYFILVTLLLISTYSIAQTTIFTESMGNVTTETTIAVHEANDGFDNDQYTMTGGGLTPAVIQNTNPSTGYSGASGQANVFFNNGQYAFAIEGINAFGYTNLTLQFAYRKESSNQLPALTVDYWNGTAYVNVPFTFNETSNAPVGWYLSPVINLPAGAQIDGLRLRWNKTGGRLTRIDDVVLTGTQTATLGIIPNTIIGLDYVFGSGPSSSQSYTLYGAFLNGSDVTITAPTNFEISLNNTDYFDSRTLTAYDGSATTIYVRLKSGLSVGSYSGNVVNAGGGATSVNVSLSGNVTAITLQIKVYLQGAYR